MPSEEETEIGTFDDFFKKRVCKHNKVYEECSECERDVFK